MVYDNETLEACHPLTEQGKETYNNILEDKADEILFKSEHPFAYYMMRFAEFIGLLSEDEED